MDWNAFIQAISPMYGRDEALAIARILEQEKIDAASVLERVLKAEPLQYIIGKTWFYKNEFLVAPGALIPRPETEELVDTIVKENLKGGKGIDIGTGSGCIAISLAKAYSNWNFTATDVSENALHLAKKNARVLGCNNLEFLQHDFLNDAFPGNEYSLIVSNPPYIAPKEAEEMEKNVLLFEPHLALFTPEADALIFYRRLREFLDYQISACTLYAEINAALGAETLDVFAAYPQRKLLKDMSGNDRFIEINKEG